MYIYIIYNVVFFFIEVIAIFLSWPKYYIKGIFIYELTTDFSFNKLLKIHSSFIYLKFSLQSIEVNRMHNLNVYILYDRFIFHNNMIKAFGYTFNIGNNISHYL